MTDDRRELITFATLYDELAFQTANEPETFPCSWLVAYTDSTEDGPQERIVECGAVATVRPDESGWDCTNGHEHTTMEARHVQGWDYFDDDEVAAIGSGHFLPAVGVRDMQGRPL